IRWAVAAAVLLVLSSTTLSGFAAYRNVEDARRNAAEARQDCDRCVSEVGQTRDLLGNAKDEIHKLRGKNTELAGKVDVGLAEMEKVKSAIPPNRATPDANRLLLERGREYTLREPETPDELVIQLSPFLAPPYYSGLEVIWDDGSESPREEVYHLGYIKLK